MSDERIVQPVFRPSSAFIEHFPHSPGQVRQLSELIDVREAIMQPQKKLSSGAVGLGGSPKTL